MKIERGNLLLLFCVKKMILPIWIQISDNYSLGKQQSVILYRWIVVISAVVALDAHGTSSLLEHNTLTREKKTE